MEQTGTRLLLIEDDRKITNFMTMALRAQNYQVTVCTTGKQGILAFCTQHPDVVILDLGLPDMDGNEIIRQIRDVSDIPILVVSARGGEADKIEALDLGANDYVTKPFSMGELLARIRVMERLVHHGAPGGQENEVLRFDTLTVDTERHLVLRDGRQIHLTPLEYRLLVLLARHPGKVLTHDFIMKEVWGYESPGDATSVRVCMASLRRKIEPDPQNPRFIRTEIGVGYRFAGL